MSERLAEHLSCFTPDATGLDRDALLFAAGRASARTQRKWQAVAGALALSQVLTLVCLWPRTPQPTRMPAPVVVDSPAPDMPPDESVPAPPLKGMWHARMRSLDFDQPESIGEEQLVPPPPPLRAFGPPPESILN
ncbi:MAG TPA: hypothetical protein VMG10_21140 [Gemmataceae bacterium]|nr:hypothetical protein [Gemmataceae bacterium]